MKELTIVWINRKDARIITANPNDIISKYHIQSSEPSLPPMGSTPEYRKTKVKARKEYFDKIVEQIENAREIVLFGPDNTKEKFLDYVNETVQAVFAKVIGVEASKDMPEEKIIARGRKYL